MDEELNEIVLEIICCPIDKSTLTYNESEQTLTCAECKVVYHVKGGVPILLPPGMQEKDTGV